MSTTTTVTIPRDLDGAAAALGQLSQLATATEWSKAAILAGHVRLSERGREMPDLAFRTPAQMAELGITGLRSRMTITLYVQAWLNEHDGNYPARGKKVALPDKPWPPTRTGTDGHNSVDGATRTIERIVDKHGAQAVVEALSEDQKREVVREIAAHTPRPEAPLAEVLTAPGGDVRDTPEFQLRAAIDHLESATNRVELALRPFNGDVPAQLLDMLERATGRTGLVLDIARGFAHAEWEAAQ